MALAIVESITIVERMSRLAPLAFPHTNFGRRMASLEFDASFDPCRDRTAFGSGYSPISYAAQKPVPRSEM